MSFQLPQAEVLLLNTPYTIPSLQTPLFFMIKLVSLASLTIAGLLLVPVFCLILYDLAVYLSRVVQLRQMSKLLIKSIFNLKESALVPTDSLSGSKRDDDHHDDDKEQHDSDSETLELQKITDVRNSRGRISFRKTVQRCEQVIYENSVTH